LVDGRNALAALIAARPAFAGTTEHDHLVRAVRGVLPPGPIRWLDVGAGDGHNLIALIQALKRGATFHVTAVEPASNVRASSPDVPLSWICARIEEVDLALPFDWVNVRHSAYYFRRPLEELARLTDALCSGGGLSLTHWSRDCVLYRIHRAALDGSPAATCPPFEEIVEAAARPRSLELVSAEVCATLLDVDALHADEGLSAALYDLALRGRVVTKRNSMTERAAFVRDLLRADPNPTRRVNGIAVLRSHVS